MKIESARVFRLGEPSVQSSWAILVALTLVGAATRLFKLDAQCLWMDEIASVANARAFATGGFKALANADRIAPLHSLIIWLMATFAGQGAIAMRLPSVIAGIFTVPAFYALSFRLFGSRRIGLVSAALVALSPYAVWYAQEARMYSFLLLCVCIYVTIAWPVVERSLRWWELSLLTLVTAIGCYTHHYMLLLSASFGLYLATQGGLAKRRCWEWLSTQLLALALFSYWLILSSDQMSAQTALAKPLGILWAPYTLFAFVFGQSFGPSTRELQMAGAGPALMHHAFSILVASVATAIVGIVGLRRVVRPEFKRIGMWLCIWLIVPVALAILATFVTKIQYNVRYAIVSFPPLVLLLSLGLSGLGCGQNAWSRLGMARNAQVRQGSSNLQVGDFGWVTSAAAIILGVCMTLSLRNWYFGDAYAKEDVRPLAQLLRHDDINKQLIVDNSRIAPILAYYGANMPAQALQIDNVKWGRTASTVLRALEQPEGNPPREIWLIEYRSWETDPAARVRKVLDARHALVQELAWPGVTLRRYFVTGSQ